MTDWWTLIAVAVIMERRMLLEIKRRVESGSSKDDEEHGRQNDALETENP